MRVFLINPPPVQGRRFIREGRCMQSVASWAAVWPPLTLAGLAAIARRRGAELRLLDCNVEPHMDTARAVALIREFAPDLVVINTGFPSIDGDAAFAAAVRAAVPETVLAGTGQFFTLLGAQSMEACPGFDAALTGEPEGGFDELLARMEQGASLENLPGLMLHRSGKVVAAPPRAPLQDLDSLPFPARDLLRRDAYRLPHNGRPFTLVNVARGCPGACSFCIAPAYHGHRLRRHSLEYTLGEIESCMCDLGLRDFLFWEEIFAHDRDFAMSLCEAFLQKGWKLSWASTTRADRVDAELLQLMKRAGCFLLGLGIESGSQEVLNLAHKGETVEDMRRAVELCRAAGVQTMGHFIFGLPGETPQTAEATVRFALSLGLDYLQCYAAVPYPGTELGDMARRNGWVRTDSWAEYDFGGKSVMDIGTIRPAEVDYYRQRLFRRFYLRPGYLARQLAGLVRHPRQLAQAAQFLRWI
jgi:radical SAM superfamily enzyme YgiQ (UPF0313 family)